MAKDLMKTYTKRIMDLWKNPKNFGQMDSPTHEYIETNKVCGDEISIQMKVDKKGIIEDVKFFGTGCLVCIISASELTEKIKGMNLEEVKKLTDDDVLKLLDMKIAPGKRYCACLALKGVKHCVESKN